MYRKSNILYILTLLCIVLLNSCTSTKSLLRDKTKSVTETAEKVIKTRRSDTLEMIVPNIVYRDTTIFKRGKTSTIYVNYDKQGKQRIGGICDSINEVIERKILEYKKNNIRDKTKETVVSNTLVIYIFIGLGILFLFIKVVNKFI